MAKRPLASAPPKPVEGQPPAAHRAPVAPYPLIDRYPTVLGSSISLQTVASVFRLAQTGYRQQYVDLLDELMEREPHGYACLAQRVLNVVGGRYEIIPADTEPGSEDEKIAKLIAQKVDKDFHNISDLRTAMYTLAMSGIFYGVGGDETSWSNDGDSNWQWRPTRLHFLHSRRLSYPDPSSWRLHVWDQGMVRGWTDNEIAPTEAIFGLPVDTMPGQFIIHTPQLRADYPTRDGLGRELAIWFCLKSLGARNASQYIERFGKPWVLGSYATRPDGNPKAADDDDIAKADAVAKSMGIGSLASSVLPDSIKWTLEGPGLKQGRIGITFKEWMEFCNGEISKVIRGQTFTTESGNYGSRSTASVGQSGELRIAAYDAACLAESIRRDLIFWMVKLNAPEHVRLCPKLVIHVEDEPSAQERIEIVSKAVQAGMPVDADAMADELGLPLVAKPEGMGDKARRMIPLAPLKPIEIAQLEDPEAALASQQDMQKAAAEAKANAPVAKSGNGKDDEEDNAPPPAH